MTSAHLVFANTCPPTSIARAVREAGPVASAEVICADGVVEDAVLATLIGVRDIEVVLTTLAKSSTEQHLVERHDAVEKRGGRLTITFVLDADADAFRALQKAPTSLLEIFRVSKAIRMRGVTVRWVVPLIGALVHRLEGLFSLADDERIDAQLVPIAALPGLRLDAAPLTEDERLFVRDFLMYRLVEASPSHQLVLDGLDDDTFGRPTGAPTIVMVGDDGGVSTEDRPARIDRQFIREVDARRERMTTFADQATEIGGVLMDGNRALLKWQRARPAEPIADDARLERVTVIGAYGGEHIGDAAILGGVLLRVHRRHGVQSAILMSQRPDHTRRLVQLLDVPVDIRVAEYEHGPIVDAIANTDGVVYAGGPLMDLPKQLVRHLYTVSTAKRDNKPVILEGIGAGPFQRRASEWMGRQITRSANRISLRTAADAEISIMKGLKFEVGQDPAFDYLASRETLTRYPDVDRAWVDALLADREDKKVIAINLRPIRPLFTTGVDPAQRESYTRFVERRFEERLAEAMRLYAKAVSKKVRFVFYSMNSIQFGSSDLRSAYRVARHVRNEVDYRVWQGDPTIDGVLALLRKVDAVIAMRFHANIFALSQGRTVIGIDYRPGQKDKVDALLRDRDMADQVRRIDDMTVEWMLDRMRHLD